MLSIYGLAWRGVRENRVRTALSVVAVALAVAVAIAGSVIVDSMRAGILQSEELAVMMGGLIDMLDPAMQFIGLALLLAAGFLIFNTFSMAITQRRQQIGGLRALGMTRAQVMRLILAEALLLAVVGVVLGVLLSPLLSRGLIAVMQGIAGSMLNFGAATPKPAVMLVAGLGGLLVTLAAVSVPARRAAHVMPMDALRPPDAAAIERTARWYTWPGGLLVLALLAVVLVAPPGEWVRYPLDITLTALFIVLWLVGVTLLLPASIGLAARFSRRFLPSATGRIMTDNLQRARGRVTLTVMTLAFALLVLIGLTGFMYFFIGTFTAVMERAVEREAMFVARVEIAGGFATIVDNGLDTILLTDAEVQAVYDVAAARGTTIPVRLALVPELSLIGSGYFSHIMDPALIAALGDTIFTFTEGDWETAGPVMQAGCGVLVAPSLADRQGLRVGDRLTVTGIDGPVDCTVAGVGTSVGGGATIISDRARAHFTTMNPMMVFVVPHFTADPDALAADLLALRGDYPALRLNRMPAFLQATDEMLVIVNLSLNTMLVLATAAAAFGVVNAVMMSVDERRREIALLRALGMTRAQTRRVILGEAALMGAAGGIVGFLAGTGAVLVIAMTYGVNGFDPNIDLWALALESLWAALPVGVVGLLAAPLIAALAAWFPARGILRRGITGTPQG